MPSNNLYQYSVLSALMSGAASSGAPLSHILSHGTHGLGTFQSLQGELIILDGSAYQIKSDGSVTPDLEKDDPDRIIPFAMVTPFEPTTTSTVSFGSKQELSEKISALLPRTANHFLAFRVDGVFEGVSVRTVGGQISRHEGLVNVGKRQTTKTFPSIRGTIVGFRSPAWFQGISVAGDHMHLISEDRKVGGHLQDLRAGMEGVRLSAATIHRFDLELPEEDDDFRDAQLGVDDEGIRAVEG
ncbi:alpha-acetolactate decarboxylase [Aaosphaeria arxii CBS 175.79]|uniref:Alpha-acetolactate decarboxylase n=1 Tax=Aaosphaeria arxii CBS 175.79 TaxID=1450172 RepID=A0A6A5XXR0_9PLEO|nr:alpha-acetolactate decarboxylase [Aaosphaeria arxii CBS 175.79]KAF2017693.1 alpha-acetolactate decarboxylase [Aaosphaeria arxii CBS 175.79]